MSVSSSLQQSVFLTVAGTKLTVPFSVPIRSRMYLSILSLWSLGRLSATEAKSVSPRRCEIRPYNEAEMLCDCGALF